MFMYQYELFAIEDSLQGQPQLRAVGQLAEGEADARGTSGPVSLNTTTSAARVDSTLQTYTVARISSHIKMRQRNACDDVC